MPRNSLFPGFIKIYYQSLNHPHVQTLPVKPFLGVGDTWYLEEKGGGPGDTFTVKVTEYANLLKGFLNTASNIQSADLYTMASTTAEPVFVQSVALNMAGTHVTAGTLYAQNTVTFRTTLGGIYRWVVMEGGGITVNQESYPPFAGGLGAFVTWMTGNESCVFGRDGGALLAGVRMLTKTNDALRKKYLLDA